MEKMIDKNRLSKCFVELCEIESPSRQEAGVFAYLKECFTKLGADEILEDSSSTKTGANCNNLIVKFNGNGGESVLFSTHMDTVLPCEGLKVVRDGDIFSSEGDTILGGDDKSGIVPLIELITILKQNNTPHCPIECVFTVCEEIGLLGAKHLDYTLLQSKFGYALDSTGINNIITAAPAANKIRIKIHGAAAHAGFRPEDGINALQIGSKAIAKVKLGRLDYETTSNLGVIYGGVAQNIVPDLLTIEGEVRSHDPKKLKTETDTLVKVFQDEIDNWDGPAAQHGLSPKLSFEITSDYPAMRLNTDDYVIKRAISASESIGISQNFIIGGGGSDANIFNSFGIQTAILATGMAKVHTTDEYLDLNDMVTLTKVLYAIVTDLESSL